MQDSPTNGAGKEMSEPNADTAAPEAPTAHVSVPPPDPEPAAARMFAAAGRQGPIETVSLAQRPPPTAATEPKSQIDRYIVTGLLGKGGMGVVYAAYDPQLERRLAIKLLLRHRTEGGTDPLALSLLDEAKALAKLNHPNVVSIYDVGTVDGEIYIAMEYIEGNTLSTWLKAKERNWRDVVDEFIAAGRGLAAAHEAGLVHGDFKPSNVIRGDDGRTRVMDFGIARPNRRYETRRNRSAGDDTASGSEIAGTPGYMAPEQLRGQEIDARADQFSFCVSLFRGLYGIAPFSAQVDLDELTDHIERIECGQVRAIRAKKAVPAWLHKLVVRGLHANPADRWPDMQTLLAALVAGRKRRQRLLRRGAIATTVVVGVTAGPVWSTFVGTPCTSAREQIAGAWNDERRTRISDRFAAIEQPFAQTTNERVLATLDDYAAHWVAMHTEACEATRVHEEQSERLMDARMACLYERRAELAALVGLLEQANVTFAVKAVEATTNLTSVDECGDRQRVLTLLQGASERGGAHSQELEGQLGEAKMRIRLGQEQQGLDLATAVAESARSLDLDSLFARAQLQRGLAHSGLGQYEAAVAAYSEGYAAALRVRDEWTAARVTSELAQIYADKLEQGKLALQWLSFAEALPEASQLDLLATKATVYFRVGKFEESAAAIEHALELPARSEQAEPFTVAQLRVTLGNVEYAQGHYQRAAEQARMAREMFEELLGEHHPTVAETLQNEATCLTQSGQHDRALELLARARSIVISTYGANHPEVPDILHNEAIVLFNLDRLEESLAKYEEALPLQEQLLGLRHPKVANALDNMASVMVNLARYEAALEYHERALDIRLEAYGEDHLNVFVSYHNLGNALYGLQRHREGVEAHQKALDGTVRQFSHQHPVAVETHRRLGVGLLVLRRYAQAAKHFRQAEAHLEDPQALVEVRVGAATALIELGRTKEAEDLLRKAIEVADKHEELAQQGARARSHLASVLIKSKRGAEGCELAEEARSRLESHDERQELVQRLGKQCRWQTATLPRRPGDGM